MKNRSAARATTLAKPLPARSMAALSLRVFGAVIALMALTTALFAQERTVNDPNLVTPGKLTVGTGDPVYAPWMLNNDPAGGEGFENGLVYALAAEMGFAPGDVVWTGNSFDQTIAPGPKDFDFAIQQISVTGARAQVVTFSDVYYQPEKAVIALPGSPVIDATSFDDLRTARWGVTLGTTDADYLENILGISDAAVYSQQVDVFLAMQSGQIDATVFALPSALFVTAVQVPDAEITALLPSDANDRGHGLLFEYDNPLVDWVNDALTNVIDAGTIEELKATYLVSDPDLPVISE
ncbi:ABC transporter substrate-binding protein [Roseicitreum antarcticum]|uniref:Amino acid ABC transporter substrate-binding protein, PAAT family n=1 Tax=Roseicitreum antarcticum TaxID=564137 RepID=A0A1H2RX94_9RHOB|nr:ABC transporter substrate-binding protein [Roseicitreum antarcticum]SDW23915.1 amino acid ABC transporter substrate-binding protein, PAAT family [Roseicitreum antarcticum]